MANGDFDSLQIEIGASSKQAAADVGKLVDQMERLKKTMSGNWNNPVKDIANTVTRSDTSANNRELVSNAKKAVKIRVDSSDADKANKKVSLLSKTLNGLKRIAFYRAIRSSIKAVTDAVQEGTENAYWYSRTMGGQIGYVAEAFDKLSSTGFKANNQFGAAWASLKSAIAPILIWIIDLATKAANALTQFFAALGGNRYYMKATDYTKRWADATSKGAAAAKEWKNQLMSFDEINRLEEPSGGGSGGGGASTPDYGDMFQTEKLSKWAEWIRNHLELIKDLALAIGAALGTWALSSFFTKDLKKAFGLAMAVFGAVMLVKGGLDAWNNGVDWSNMFEMLLGTTALAAGLGLAFGKIGFAVGVLIGSVAMLVVGIKDWIEKGELTTQTFVLLEEGILGVGLALSVLTGNWIPLVVAGIAGLALAVYKNWDKIKTFFKEGWETVKSVFEFAKEYFKNTFGLFVSAFETSFSSAWNILKSFLDVVKNFVGGIGKFFTGLYNFVVGVFTANWKRAIDGIGSILSGIFDVSVGTIKAAANLIISVVEGLINYVISGLNLILSGFNKVASAIGGLFGFGEVNLSIGYKSLPRFANGGFPEDGLFFANHNELVGQFSNGRTAVANNEQIEAGIARGVEEANEGVVSVLYQLLSVAEDIARNSQRGNGYDLASLSREVSKYQARTARAGGV